MLPQARIAFGYVLLQYPRPNIGDVNGSPNRLC